MSEKADEVLRQAVEVNMAAADSENEHRALIASQFHLRIFLTSYCNMRCTYCNPDADRQDGRALTNSELITLIEVASKLGVRTIHYSGGEPTLRRGLADIMRSASDNGVATQAMTTNGVLLFDTFGEYVEAGLSRVNISIDSLDDSKFKRITGTPTLDIVKGAILRAIDYFGMVKINVVVLQQNVDEIPAFLDWSASLDGKLICRFIELQSNQPVFYHPERISAEHVNSKEIWQRIRSVGTPIPIAVTGKNPNCFYYQFPGTPIQFGLITNHSRGYPCGGCRKIRVSPYGDVGVCITAEGQNLKGVDRDTVRRVLAEQIEFRGKLDSIRPNRRHHSTDFGFWRWGDMNPARENRPIEVRNSER